MNSPLLFRTLCLILCISSLSQAQSNTIPNKHQYRSLWIGTEIIRTLTVITPSENSALSHQALDLNIEYGLRPTYRAYLHTGYGSLRNTNYWNELYYIRTGIKYAPKGRKTRAMVGVGLMSYVLHETQKDPFNSSLIYNDWLTGFGLEFPIDVRVPLFANLELKFDLSTNITYNPDLKGTSIPTRYYLSGISLFALSRPLQYNLNLGIGLIYRFDWRSKNVKK